MPPLSPSVKLKRWLPPLCMAGVIFLLSTDLGSSANTHSSVLSVISHLVYPRIVYLPEVHQRIFEVVVRKAAHITVYALFSPLLFGSFYSGGMSYRKSVLWTALIVALFALSDEFHQQFVKSRTPSLRDVGFDFTGGIIGILAVSYGCYLQRLRDRMKPPMTQSN